MEKGKQKSPIIDLPIIMSSSEKSQNIYTEFTD